MANRVSSKYLVAGISALALALAACGGGGSAGGVSFIPAPPASPATPSVSASKPLSAPPVGVTSTTQLASIGELDEVRWNAELQVYEVKVSGYSAGHIAPTTRGPYAEAGKLIAADGSPTNVFVHAWTGLEYTRFGYLAATDGSASGSFAFGVATLPGGVPVTGTATYLAQLDGAAYDANGVPTWTLYGGAAFNFDFAAGTLSGHMDPKLNGPMDVPTLPRYNFISTIFSPGSTSFSGAFDVIGPTPSSFSGQFTGPAAQELMAGFRAPYFDGFSNTWGELRGVIAGQR